MATQNFPFMFDGEKVKALFAAVKMPVVDTDAVIAAQKKNLEAVIEANKFIVAGYQNLYKRQIALFEAAVAEAKDKLAEVHGQPLTADQAAHNIEAMKSAFEKAAAQINELAEMAQKANTGAFEIVSARAEAAVAEFKAAAEKAVA